MTHRPSITFEAVRIRIVYDPFRGISEFAYGFAKCNVAAPRSLFLIVYGSELV